MRSAGNIGLKAPFLVAMALAAAISASSVAASGEDLTARYEGEGAGPFSAAAGQSAWGAEHRPPGADAARSCATCHGTDLTKPGRHATTGKSIEPMALSANPQRLSDPTKAERWFNRNCRWTLGRECTAQEKGDFVLLMQSR
jgi:hypothetical protein